MSRRVWLVAAGLVLVVAPAFADPSPEDTALSAQLFEQGRQLLAAGKTEEGCAKLEESERLVPADGTLLNVAVCQEKLGKTASAFAAFTEARAHALRDKRTDRVAFAEKHLKALEPKLSRLTITVPPEADLPELHVYRDGTEIGRAAWGTGMPVDPGDHQIEAKASGRTPWLHSVHVGADGDKQVVSLTVLEKEAALPASSSAPVAPPPAPPPTTAPPASTTPLPQRAPPPEEPPGNPRRTIAYVLGGVGIVGVGVGSYFGLRAFSKWSKSSDGCPNDRCSAAAVADANDARKAADVSTASFAIGAVAIGAATWLFFTSGSTESPRSGLAVGGALTSHGANASLRGRF